MATDIVFGKEDVTVQEMEIGDCGECGNTIKTGYYIQLDFRGAGQSVQFGQDLYCSSTCAETVAEAIRATLPECEE
jgi:hypothetical protein